MVKRPTYITLRLVQENYCRDHIEYIDIRKKSKSIRIAWSTESNTRMTFLKHTMVPSERRRLLRLKYPTISNIIANRLYRIKLNTYKPFVFYPKRCDELSLELSRSSSNYEQKHSKVRNQPHTICYPSSNSHSPMFWRIPNSDYPTHINHQQWTIQGINRKNHMLHNLIDLLS